MIPEFDIDQFVADSIKAHKEVQIERGFKECTCRACKRLMCPVMIKEHRDPADFE